MTKYLLLFNSYGLVLWDVHSDERTVLSFLQAAGPCQCSVPRVRVPWDSQQFFALLDLRLPFVATYDSQDHGGVSRPCLHTKVKPNSGYIAESRTTEKTSPILVLQCNCLTMSYNCIFLFLFVAARRFTESLPSNDDIPLLLKKRPICHNM
jgi:hypothetical protein